jgi:hypothetical protein
MSILSAIFVVGNVDLYLLERVLPLLFGIADFIKLLRVVPTHAYILAKVLPKNALFFFSKEIYRKNAASGLPGAALDPRAGLLPKRV